MSFHFSFGVLVEGWGHIGGEMSEIQRFIVRELRDAA